ncbi:MAG: PucR family transcriptional regulator [Anaerofustis sp.]
MNNLIVIEEDVSMLTVFNEIIDIFLTFNRWERQMTDDINNFVTFGRMFDDLTPVVDQGVFLANSKFHMVGFTKKYLANFPDLEIKQAQKMIVKQNFRDLDSVTDVFQYKAIEHCIHKNIFYHNEYVGRLGTWYYPDEEKNAYYSHILTYFGKYLEDLYAQTGSFERESGMTQVLKTTLIELIGGNTVEFYTLNEILQMNQYQPDDEYYLIQLKTNAQKDASDIYADYIGEQMERKWRGVTCVNAESSTVILLNATVYGKYETADFFQQLTYYIRDSMLFAAVSRKFSNLQNVRMAYRQTEIAFHFGRVTDASHWIYRFDNHVYDFLLQSAADGFSPDQVAIPALVQLRSHDGKHQTEYYKTLFEYIRQQYNATAAAQVLFIARSTFLNRLERIVELTGLDLDDWKQRLYLTLSYYFYENEAEKASDAKSRQMKE